MSASPLDSPVQDRPLADAINVATRSLHTRLNKLILARMPLALPPQAVDPTIYLSGLLHIAPVYIAFEELWRDLVERRVSASLATSDKSLSGGVDATAAAPDEAFPGRLDAQHDAAAAAAPPVCDRLHSILASLYVPGLVRSDRLRADIASLTGWSPQVVEARLQSVSRTGHLAAFVQHVRRVVSHKPHVLVAYTYILFMALFAGGRFIRATLESAGLPFWESQPVIVEPSLRAPEDGQPLEGQDDHHHHLHRPRHAHEATRNEPPAADSKPPSLPAMPVRFLHFNTPADGEDLKREYKQKLSESEASLTHREKRDIVQEGICIFENMILVVHQLDAVCAAPNPTAERQECTWSIAGLMKNAHVVGDRFRDSIAVTRQRWEKSSAKQPLANDDHDDAKAVDAPKGSGAPPAICPAPAKSVRFDGSLPNPTRCLTDGSAARQIRSAQVAKWLLVMVLGVFSLGMFFTGRRSLLDWLRL
ncbi:hypothetical protein G6O67_002990 [Ophiocordyceps sinensis]|uniref:Hem oxygenase-like, multi-helical n=1 Tax=Ophiocordyceps sinensis TaxID=72228 RepID=A0A8H4PVI9_9HYPO|nr:hypothetical protein G6O67_002990 [Ophiocordyceps sinensis]